MTPTRQKTLDFLGISDDETGILLLEPECFDDAILGVAEYWTEGSRRMNVAYSRNRVIDILMATGAGERDEAEEYFEFNIAGAYHGEGTPVFVDERYAE